MSGVDHDPLSFGAPVSHHVLENGLEVVIIPDHRSPVATHMVWYRNGSADDPQGQSGIAHFLEHLMFKGTEKHPQGAFSDLVTELGGEENAFTSMDYTAYYQRVAKEHLGRMMELEADRMQGLVLEDAVVLPERDVVLGELPVRMSMAGCEAQGALFAISHVTVPVGADAADLEQAWRSAALAQMQASQSEVLTLPHRPQSPLVHLTRATGQKSDGSPVQASLAWVAHEGSVFHLAVYAKVTSATLTEPLLGDLQWR
jgi:predicted Zn-dependent peptidase